MNRKQQRLNRERGNALIEFAFVTILLIPVLAGSCTIGMFVANSIKVSAVCREAAVLFLRATIDPAGGFDLSQSYNQAIIVRAAAGLGMNQPGNNLPNPSGLGAVILSKVVNVGAAECSAGVVPLPSPFPGWNTSNCANYGSYVFAGRIVIGNGSRFSSRIGTPPAGALQADGTVSAHNIATNSALQAPGFASVLPLNASTFGLVSEMYADLSRLNLFSILSNPVVYVRNFT
jgi:hypothetical protein